MKSNISCAVYTRVSTDNQAEVEFNSCEAQEAKIRSFIKSQENMTVFDLYSDLGYTGANLNRPDLTRLLNDIKAGNINLVISYKIDRLTRSPKDFYWLIELFEQNDVDFISVTERFDTSTAAGRLLRNIMLTFAGYERELTSERTRDKMIQRAEKGMWNGGLIPHGYRTENKKLLIDESESPNVRKIFEIFLTTQSTAKVYNRLKRGGIKDRKGNHFSKGAITYILKNIVYTGKVKYSGKIYPGIHEAIISDEMFRTAQQCFKKKKRYLRQYKYFPFAGLVKCRECGSTMTPFHTNKIRNGKRTRYYYYRCTCTFKKDWNSCSTKQVSANRLEDFIFENLERTSIDRHYIENLMFRLNNTPSGDRTGLGLTFESSKISGDIFEQTLQNFVKGASLRKGIEKNLWVRKFIPGIIYSKEHIQINMVYSAYAQRATADRSSSLPHRTTTDRASAADLSAGGEDFKDFILAEKEKNAAVGGKKFAPEKKKPDGDFSPSGMEKMVRFPSNSSGLNFGSNHVPLIFPNTIHKCKKKNLHR